MRKELPWSYIGNHVRATTRVPPTGAVHITGDHKGPHPTSSPLPPLLYDAAPPSRTREARVRPSYGRGERGGAGRGGPLWSPVCPKFGVGRVLMVARLPQIWCWEDPHGRPCVSSDPTMPDWGFLYTEQYIPCYNPLVQMMESAG